MDNMTNLTPEEKLDWIEKYLEGGLDEDQKKTIEHLLNIDAEFRGQLEDLKLIQLAIKEVDIESQLEVFHNKIDQNKRKSSVRKIHPFLKIAASISIFLLSGVGLWWFLHHNKSEDKLYAQYYKPDPGLPTVMSSSADYTFDEAMQAYKLGSYQEAALSWEKQLKTKVNNDTLNYFLGSTYLAQGKLEAAIEKFDSVLANKASIFLEDASWYKGLAYVKLGQLNKAKQTIIHVDHPKKEQLLKELDKE